MIDFATRVHPELPTIYRMATYDGGYLNDRLWVQAMSTARYMDEVRRGNLRSGPDESILWRMIRCGVLDHSEEDKVWDSSTRAMRQSAVIGDRLWSLIEKEQEKVLLLFLLSVVERRIEVVPRMIVWSANCAWQR